MNKKSLFILLLLILSFSGWAQNSKHQAWKIKYKYKIKAGPGASEDLKASVHKINQQVDSIRIELLVSDHAYRYLTEEGKEIKDLLIIYRKDSMTYSKVPYKKEMISQQATSDLSQNNEKAHLINPQIFKDSLKTIQGHPTRKQIWYSNQSSDSVKTVVWSALDMPNWFNDLAPSATEGVVGLKTSIFIISDGTPIQTDLEAVSVKQVQVSPKAFAIPEGFKVIPSKDYWNSFYDDSDDEESHDSSSESQASADSPQRDSLVALLKRIKNRNRSFESASAFQNGFAGVTQDSTSSYIAQNGQYLFDKIVDQYHLILSIEPLQPGWENIKRDKKVTNYIVSKKGKIGLLNNQGRWILPPKYDTISVDFKRYLLLKKGDKIGYADTQGKNLLPVQFDNANIMNGNYFDVKKNGKWGVYGRKQYKMVIPFSYDEFDFCGGCGGESSYAYASKNGKWGVISFKDSILVPFKYGHPGHYNMRNDNWVTSFSRGDKDVVINMNTHQVYSEAEYEAMRVISGALTLRKDGKYALISKTGKMLFNFQFDEVADPYDHFHWGPFIQVYKNNKVGIITNEGKEIVSPNEYDNVWYDAGHFVAKKKDETGLLDSLGKVCLPFKYDRISGRYGMNITTKTGKKVQLFEIDKGDFAGFYNPQNGVVVSPQFSMIKPVLNRDSTQVFVEVKIARDSTLSSFKEGLYTLLGEEIMPAKYENYSFLTDRYAEVSQNNKSGLFDLKTQRQVTPTEYSIISKINDRYVLLNRYPPEGRDELYDIKKGKIVQLSFPRINSTDNPNVLIVSDSLETYLYNLKKQKTISKPYHSSYYQMGIRPFKHGLAKVSKQDKEGFINEKGKEIIPPKYDNAKINSQGLIRLVEQKDNQLWAVSYADSLGQLLTKQPFAFNEYYGNPYEKFQLGNVLWTSAYGDKNRANNYGLIDLTGKQILPPKFTNIIVLENGKGFVAKRNGKFGIFNTQGKEILPPVLDNVYFNEVNRGYITKGKADFPLLCELDGVLFYVQSSGAILPTIAKNYGQGNDYNGWGF